MTDQPDPWKGIAPPAQATSVSGRRVAPDIQWALYWAIDNDNSCLLMLRYESENRPEGRLPNLRGLEIETRQPQPEGEGLLVIRLKDNEQRDIFHRLCLDIIDATRAAKSEPEAIGRFLSRTWRWHWLLRGGRDDKLTSEEQKGLMGELWILQQILIPNIGAATAVQAWTGPLDAPKDFEIGRICIEAKARRGSATPYVAISSEIQLDRSGLERLFMNVLNVSASSADDPKGVSVTDMSKVVLEDIQNLDASVVNSFEERLFAYGFDWSHDYSDSKWLIGTDTLFEIVDDFPCITPTMYRTGISSVRYWISLQECEPFRFDQGELISLLKGMENDNQH